MPLDATTETAKAEAAKSETAWRGPRTFADDLPGDTLCEKLDALHARHFDGTALTTHTTLWNMVHAFKEDAKKLFPDT